MFKFICGLFKRKSVQEKIDECISNCTIEYRPIEGKYYPKLSGSYLYLSRHQPESFHSERNARNFIHLYLEQQYNFNVVEIKL